MHNFTNDHQHASTIGMGKSNLNVANYSRHARSADILQDYILLISSSTQYVWISEELAEEELLRDQETTSYAHTARIYAEPRDISKRSAAFRGDDFPDGVEHAREGRRGHLRKQTRGSILDSWFLEREGQIARGAASGNAVSWAHQELDSVRKNKQIPSARPLAEHAAEAHPSSFIADPKV